MLVVLLAVYYRNSPIAFAGGRPEAVEDSVDVSARSFRQFTPIKAADTAPSKVKVRKYFPETWIWEAKNAG